MTEETNQALQQLQQLQEALKNISAEKTALDQSYLEQIRINVQQKIITVLVKNELEEVKQLLQAANFETTLSKKELEEQKEIVSALQEELVALKTPPANDSEIANAEAEQSA